MKSTVITTLILLCLQANVDNRPERQETVTSAIRVMSYNIRYNTSEDGVNAWPYRKDHVAEMIGTKYGADIAGLQEVLSGQLDHLQERLPGYSWIGKGRDDGKDAGEFSPIFYKAEKFTLLKGGAFWLSETPDIPGSKSWDAAFTRIVTWAFFREKSSGFEFYFFNTHFDHRGDLARLKSAEILVDKVSEIQENVPVIVTGDMNVRESSEAYAVFTGESRLYDARYVSETGHTGPTTSSNNWEDLRSPESRIDYIFVRNVARVLSHRILEDRYEGRFPSDHLPVLADLVLK